VEKSHDKKLLDRLHRIEGQVRGVSKMLADGRYCIDVLTQIRAIRAALSGVETVMLQEHLSHCIEGAITSGDPAAQRKKAAELIQLLDRAK
jgi:DNA-binding FrmR family transcriptional regulator